MCVLAVEVCRNHCVLLLLALCLSAVLLALSASPLSWCVRAPLHALRLPRCAVRVSVSLPPYLARACGDEPRTAAHFFFLFLSWFLSLIIIIIIYFHRACSQTNRGVIK